ncbi:MFS transporter [Isosphaeraceae bacterium EP7]
MSSMPEDRAAARRRREPWVVVALLWFCGFFNYADRQAVFSVLPLIRSEFALNDTQVGYLGSAFMIVYALAAPIAGSVVDRRPRRTLIVLGLGVWSAVCALTGTARSFAQLIFYRAAEGLGESFYFPASMSLLADHHGKRTRSKAMAIHQSSVYLGTIGGGALAGLMAQWTGDWRTPFLVLGLVGMAYAVSLRFLLNEPKRGATEEPGSLALDPEFSAHVAPPHDPEIRETFGDRLSEFGRRLGLIVRQPAAVFLLLGFGVANFVAASLLAWLPLFVFNKFKLNLANASLTATTSMQLGSVLGVLLGGWLADRAARRAGGRMRVQALGLIFAAPFLYVLGTTESVAILIATLGAVGLGKGIYDSNIFAAMYDVVPVEVRGTAAGLLNTVGWTFGSLAPTAIGIVADSRYGLSIALASTTAFYFVAAGLVLIAGFLARRRAAGL